MIKEIPMLFSTPMVQATLDDRKTNTRRLRALNFINEKPDRYKFHGIDDNGCALFEDLQPEITPWISAIKCPYGKLGDLLWVRETHIETPGGKFHYKADIPIEKDLNRKGYIDTGHSWAKWKPSIHMQKRGARIWLRVTDVRVERLNEISEHDAIAEGWPGNVCVLGDSYCNCAGYNPISWYEMLWESINGPGSWALNPWVWVIKFEVLSKTGRPTNI